MANFTANTYYEFGTPSHGVQPAILCTKVTAKFVTFDGVCEVKRVKINNYHNDTQAAEYCGEIIKANQTTQPVSYL